MTKPAITKRQVKGTPLTYSELDTNFQNLRDATVTLQAGTGGTSVVSDLNGTITLVAGTGIVLSGDNTAKTVTLSTTESQNIFQNIAVSGQSTVSADAASDTLTLVAGSNITITTNATTDTITFASTGGDLVNDTTPQLGGNLDVNGYSIVSLSNGTIALSPNGYGTVNAETQNFIVGKSSASTTAAISAATGITRLTISDGVNTVQIDETLGILLDTDPGLPIKLSAGSTGDIIELDGSLKIRSSTGTPTTFENGYYEDMLQTPVSWLKVDIGGSYYYIPLFQ
jgi:hypothetical protein